MLGLFLVDENVMLHLLQVHFIVELDDVLRLASLMIDDAVLVDLFDMPLELEQLSVLRDDVVESDLPEVAYLDDGIDRAH